MMLTLIATVLLLGSEPVVEVPAESDQPSVERATDGLVRDGRHLRVDMASLFDDHPETAASVHEREPVKKLFADVAAAIAEELAEDEAAEQPATNRLPPEPQS
jgi:hypothetical protein